MSRVEEEVAHTFSVYFRSQELATNLDTVLIINPLSLFTVEHVKKEPRDSALANNWLDSVYIVWLQNTGCNSYFYPSVPVFIKYELNTNRRCNCDLI